MHSRNNSRFALVPLAMGSAIALAACSAGAGDSNSSESSEGEVVKIGFIGALTGGSASLNVPIEQGLQLAAAELNESGELDGRTIELVVEDDQADATRSAQAAERLVSEEGVIAVIGGGNSATVAANNPIITGSGVVQLISVAQTDPLVDPESPGFPLTFRVTENNSYDVGAIAGLFEDGAYDHICAVADTTEYGQSGLETIRAVFEERGLELQDVAQHDVGATDMTPQVLSLRDAGCDAVYLFSLGADAAVFMKGVNQAGWDVPVIGGRGLNQGAFLSIAGDGADGIIMPSTTDPENPRGVEFAEAFDAEYGPDADPGHVFSALGFDTLQILVAALQDSGWEGGEALAASLETIEHEGAAGREGSSYSYTADDHEGPGEDFLVFVRIEDGAYVLETRDVTSGN